MGMVRSIIFNNHIGHAGFVAIANSPHLANLTTLHLEGNQLRRRAMKVLAFSPHLTMEAKRSCFSRMTKEIDELPDELCAQIRALLGE